LIDYPQIDGGMTRREYNANVVDLNLERAARSDNPVTAAWAQFEKDQIAKDRALENRLAGERYRRTAEMRSTANRYNGEIRRLRAESRMKQRSARTNISDRFAEERETLRAEQRRQREALRTRQGRLYLRLIAAIDITGITRRKREAERKNLSATHREERAALSERYREMKRFKVAMVRDKYENQIEAAHSRKLKHLSALHDKHGEAERFGDRERQQREAEREQARLAAEQKIQDWSKSRSGSFARQQDAGAGKEEGKAGSGGALANAFRKARDKKDNNTQSIARRNDHGRKL